MCWLACGWSSRTIFSCVHWRKIGPRVLTCWGFAAACALNVLTKGLIGLVFPIGTIGLYLLLTRNLRHLAKLRLVSSTLVFLVLAAPWHILAALRNPAQGQARGFLWFYFVNEHINRFLNKRVPPGYDTVPLLLFWALLVLWLVPWAVFLPQALRDVPLRLQQMGASLRPPQESKPPLFSVGFSDPALLQLLHAAGVLHDPRVARHRAAGGWMSGSGVFPQCNRGRTARWTPVLAGSDGRRYSWWSNWPGTSHHDAPASGGRGLGGTTKEEPARLRFFIGTRTRFHAPSLRDVSWPASRGLSIFVARDCSELVDAAPRQACLGERSVVAHDGLPAKLCAYFVRALFANPFFV